MPPLPQDAAVLMLIALLDIAVFLVMGVWTGAFDWDAQTLYGWGGNLGSDTLHGQAWRLFTSMNLHANFQHIAGNMIMLAVVGIYVEVRLGSVYAVLIYLVSGLAAAALSAAVHPQIVSVGASGAIAGLVAVMVVLYLCDDRKDIGGAWLLRILVINGLYSFAPGVDGVGHLGGFVAGLGCGMAVLAVRRRQQAGPGTPSG